MNQLQHPAAQIALLNRILENAHAEIQHLRDRIEELEAAIGLAPEAWSEIAVFLHTTPSRAKMLSMLLARDFCSYDFFFTAMYADKPDCDWPEQKILSVHKFHLDKLLKPLGISIGIRRCEGYFIAPADKDKFRALCPKAFPARQARA